MHASEFPELFPSPPRIPDRPPRFTHGKPQAFDTSEESYPLQEETESEQRLPDEESLSGQDVSAAGEVDPSDPVWYYSRESQQYGPEPLSKLQFLASMGQIEPTDLVWTEGMPDWGEAYRIEGLFDESSSVWQQEPDTEPAAISPMAVGSFVLGLLGTNLLFFVGSIAAVVFGHVALRHIRDNEGTVSGRGMAIAGLILGYMVIVATTLIGIIVLCLFLLRDTLGSSV